MVITTDPIKRLTVLLSWCFFGGAALGIIVWLTPVTGHDSNELGLAAFFGVLGVLYIVLGRIANKIPTSKTPMATYALYRDDKPPVRVRYGIDRPLSWKDGVAMLSCYLITVASFVPGILLLPFLLPPRTGPVPDSEILPLLVRMAPAFAVMIPCAIISKYIWLLLMSRIVSRDNVGPIIAFGRRGKPRRFIRLDSWILENWFKD